jgi:hypothetical protein
MASQTPSAEQDEQDRQRGEHIAEAQEIAAKLARRRAEREEQRKRELQRSRDESFRITRYDD